MSAPPSTDKSTSPKNDVEAPPPHSIYSHAEKAFLITLVSIAATFSGFASNIYFPCLPTIAEDLSVSVELVNLSVTSYMIFQGLAPTIWGAVADVHGRRLVYISTFIIFFAACIGLAQTRNYATLVVVRCLQSTGSAATIAIGSGVIGDITTRAERGGFMGIFQAGLLVPVAIGPVIGGALANSLGWRSIFWFLAIYSGVFLLVLIATFPETLHAIAGNGSIPQTSHLRYPLCFFQRRYAKRSGISSATQVAPPRKKINVLDPVRVLFTPCILPTITNLALHYAVWQMSITALSTQMTSIYTLTTTQVGLTFLANGIGSMIGTLLTGKILDLSYSRYVKKSNGEHPEPSARLATIWVWSIMEILSVLLFGWSLDKQIYLAVPIISTFFIGWSAVGIQSTISTYLVDEYPNKSASASAALNLARCLLGAAGTSIVQVLVNAVGVGVSFTICAAVLAVALVGNLLIMRLLQRSYN